VPQKPKRKKYFHIFDQDFVRSWKKRLQDPKALLHVFINASLMLFIVIFTFETAKALEIYQCTKQNDDTHILDSSPGMLFPTHNYLINACFCRNRLL
jgi:hypothetical protein